MNIIEKLWQEYLRAECGGAQPSAGQVAAQRRAFFTGAWCQFVLGRKLRGLDPATARAVNDAIELELAREVCAPAATAGIEPARELAA